MKILSGDSNAVSEVVGALMLVLVVVIAASSFAVFISQQQKIQQDNQLIKDEQSGESLLISSLKTNISEDGTFWTSLNASISSLHQGNSNIDQISINKHVLRSFHVARFNETTSTFEYVKYYYYQQFTITSQQTVNINVSTSDFLETGLKISTNGAIALDLYTAYSNEFSKVFYSPAPIISINVESQWNSTTTDPHFDSYLILDGSQSDQPGDSTIIKWNWTAECHNINYTIPENRSLTNE